MSSQISRLTSSKEVRWLFALSLVSLVPRLVFALLVSTMPVSDFAWYDERAADLAAGLGYQENGTPTSYWPPGYPFALSIVYRLVGHSFLAGMLFNAMLGVAICILTYKVAKILVGYAGAKLAGGFVALFPSQIFYTNVLGSETLFTALFLVIIYLFVRGQSRDHGLAHVAVLGLIIGLAALVRPLVLLFLIVMFVAWLISGASLRRAVGLFSIALLFSAFTILPWTIRNIIQMDAPVLISTNGGIDFWIGNNPEATGRYWFPPDGPLNAELFHGEVEREREGYRLGINFILQYPIDALSLIPRKIYYLIGNDTSGAYWATSKLERPLPLVSPWALASTSKYYYFTILALAVVSLVILREWRRHPGAVLPLTLIYWVAGHVVFFGSDRFHFPIVPLLAVAATGVIPLIAAGYKYMQLLVRKHA
ncbi:MAG: glycosyltransferase family 39 protein [Chloroflexi bacterium]|nr:glycosyltransferase family 39 protein [Chloroflexota bacterium]